MNPSTAFSNWSLASAELGFEFVSPFSFAHAGTTHACFAWLPEFGSRRGIILILDYDADILTACAAEGIAYSCLFEHDEPYRVEHIVDTLNDWQWTSDSKPAPSWYTGKPWST